MLNYREAVRLDAEMQENRRLIKERRKPSRPFSIRQIHGRRRGSRRSQEDNAAVRASDFYRLPLLMGVIGILLLCMADAHNTLLLIDSGAQELNPLMNVLLAGDPGRFVLYKMSLTGMGLLLIVGHEQKPIWRSFRAGHLIYMILGGYICLVGYQIGLMHPDLAGWASR